MINILHRHRYWTEYVDFLLEEEKEFALVASKYADEPIYKGVSIPLFNPEVHRTILTGGIIDDQTEGNQIICRSQHSPGFYIFPHIITYRGFCQYHPKSDFKMYLLNSHYQALVTRELPHQEVDEIRYAMIADPRVKTTAVDVSLYHVLSAPKKMRHTPNSGVICLCWPVQYVEFNKVFHYLERLSKELRLTMVIHPCTDSMDFIRKCQDLEGDLLNKVYVNLSRKALIDLFDAHQYVISDGSGSMYEAMIRGCQPIAIHNLYGEKERESLAMSMVYDRLDEEYLPFPAYDEVSSWGTFDNEPYLQEMFPFLYQRSEGEAKAIVREEVLSAF